MHCEPEDKPKKNPLVVPLLMASMGVMEQTYYRRGYGPGNRTVFGDPQSKVEPKKCLLRGCEKLTTHNGGFCCAEHCKEYKRIEKKKGNKNEDSR